MGSPPAEDLNTGYPWISLYVHTFSNIFELYSCFAQGQDHTRCLVAWQNLANRHGGSRFWRKTKWWADPSQCINDWYQRCSYFIAYYLYVTHKIYHLPFFHSLWNFKLLVTCNTYNYPSPSHATLLHSTMPVCPLLILLTSHWSAFFFQKHYCDYCDVFLTHDSTSGN